MINSSCEEYRLGNAKINEKIKTVNYKADALPITNMHLTIRELDVLKLVIYGHTAKRVGLLLKISNRTVEKYIENLKLKFNCHTKSEMIFKCLDNLLIKEKIFKQIA